MARNSEEGRKLDEGRIDQNLVDDLIPQIEWRRVHESELCSSDIDWLEGDHLSLPSGMGMSAAFAKKGSVPAIALALASRDVNVRSRCLVVLLASPTSNRDATAARMHLTSRILENKSHTIYAFDIAPIILALNHFHQLHFVQAIDIQSALTGVKGREPFRAIKFMIGSSADVHKRGTTEIFDSLEFEETPKVLTHLVLRAWVSAFACASETEGLDGKFAEAPRIDTTKFLDWQIFDLSKMAHDQYRQDAGKSSSTVNNVEALEWSQSKQKLQAKSGRFQTRITDRQADVVMTVGDETTGTYRVRGRVAEAAGKSAAIKTEVKLDEKRISGMTTVGRGQHTLAEQNRALYVLEVLQGKLSPWDNPWLKAINGDSAPWPEDWATEKSPPASVENPNYPLNSSQLHAVLHMLSTKSDTHLTLIQGPPGTGKTSVIATFVLSSIQAGRRGIWLIAQSNVAVKNIAEKLFKIGFTAFRLLVSKDFKYDWHDHLYHGLDRNIIESGDFPKKPQDFKIIDGIQVILCTVSMLANPRLSGFFKRIPLQHLVIDEASQIEIGNYATIFNKAPTLRKVCFIGDDKQLPPHGTEEIEVLESIFEKSHLRDSMCFLDTQYRMPPQIGAFISQEVYNDKLESNPEHPVTSATLACRFIDVVGAAEQKSGTSWVNRKEIEAVTHLVRRLQAEDQQVRVITPYDAQRNFIEEALKKDENGLKWQDTVFNVDSFQGNEEDYIVISLVRTRDLGFLKSLRRTNVMLSRCKRGMYICSSRAFLIDGRGAESLAGKMAAHFGEPAWISMADLEGDNY